MADDQPLNWRKSSFSSNNGGECVEVADRADGGRLMRDSKNPSGPVLIFSADEFGAFVKGVRIGDFD